MYALSSGRVLCCDTYALVASSGVDTFLLRPVGTDLETPAAQALTPAISVYSDGVLSGGMRPDTGQRVFVRVPQHSIFVRQDVIHRVQALLRRDGPAAGPEVLERATDRYRMNRSLVATLIRVGLGLSTISDESGEKSSIRRPVPGRRQNRHAFRALGEV